MDGLTPGGSMNKTRDRLAGATIAVLLQLGLVTIFVYSLPLILPAKKRAREITFFLPVPHEAAKPAPAPRDRLSPLRAPVAPLVVPPPLVLPPVAPPGSDLQSFGKALFGCAPENRNNLTPEQRAHCSGLAAMPRDEGRVGELPSLVRDPARREAELAARNTPARVPCVELRTRSLGFAGAQDNGVMTDPLCMLNGWINGFGGLPP
jgi:hypothetical protein